jgi:hypothetical protein
MGIHHYPGIGSGIIGIESPEEERFTDRLFFTGFKGKNVAVGMILADVEIRAPD